MNHPHALILEKLYSDFVRGDLNAVLDACDPKVTFQVAGKSRLAGKYTRETFAGFVGQLTELSGSTFKLDAHDIMASDRHGVALVTESLTRDGKLVEMRTVHVWRFEGGKPVAWYEYPRDLYQYDAIWS